MKLYQIMIIFILTVVLPEFNGLFFKKQDIIRSSIGYLRSCGTKQDNRLKLHLFTRKYNRTHTATSMNITVYEDFGEKYSLDIELKLWGDGGWKRNFFRYKRTNACDSLYVILGPVWADIISKAGANSGCPILMGHYHFENYNIDLSKLPFISMPGRFMIIAIVTKNNVNQLCIEIDLEFKVLMDAF